MRLVVFLLRPRDGATSYETSEATMVTKIILFAVLAACGVPSPPATTEPPAE
jgi:hypothetical protein